ncbi:MAG TPA: M18 family aminopeptidase [Gammaproteobacteria bacterium]|jgi:aspartyl aminopeptidase|nr:M18 family aminopeptidase [Gammaproteobacteria bacterium]RTZ63681.1 MAG: M18 family aminopeptidase [Gammaproteobacteria bacterium]HAD38470.1 M18 family aminopeptidase [Gammaproteobacteria bacterium]HBK75310.1 M18 family aminopeptidase [Gammaproteobacteria bacterium]HHZ72432.1 M18 family aminopeptidase [Gammaproteobacteria bacterium]
MNESEFNNGLLEFLADSPTPFHAVKQLKQLLTAQGFEQLAEDSSWSLKPGGRYFVVRNGSSIVAIRTGPVHPTDGGLRLIGTHTDSPCLKIKPAPEISRQGFLQLSVEIYGGVLLSPWFDRDLSLAGRVTCRMENGEINSLLTDFRRPVATVPSLAIHLNRDVHKNRTINPQKEVVLLVSSGDGDSRSFRQLLLDQIQHEHANIPVAEVLDYEINCYDVQPPAVIGLNDDFIAASRLDNLLSCYAACRSIIDASGETTAVMVCNDHEEVGSLSASGAQGPFLRSTLERLCGNSETMNRVMDLSMLLSVDNAHAVHPNYEDKHDPQHRPCLNGGPVIKYNANQRYATNSESAALFRNLCQTLDIPVQQIAMRSDMACGSTIGPITAAELGVATVDIGSPQLAMHSVRELTGRNDPTLLYRALKGFLDQPSLWC